jgi:hypothetical protein
MKEREVFFNGLSQVMQFGCKQTSKHGTETHVIAKDLAILSVPSAGEVTMTLFWYFNGPNLEHYQEGQTVLCYA